MDFKQATVEILLELYRRHLYMAQEGREEERKRLFVLLKEFEWAYPEAKQRVDEIYPTK